MSRIRSVHPGLFTDEAFVCLSDAAQIFLIGLWTECDDRGAFEWKPVQLRIKIRANRDGTIEPLLQELEAARFIRSYVVKGRKYGLVRNFQRYQRPKKPNSLYPIPEEFRTYVTSGDDFYEPVPNQFPTSTEKSPQMEDGGWRMEKESCPKPAAPAPDLCVARGSQEVTSPPPRKRKAKIDYPEEFETFWHAYPTDPGMSKFDASKAWAKLTPEDRNKAIASMPAFRKWTSQQGTTYRMLHAATFLNSRRFDGLAASATTQPNGVPVDWSRRMEIARNVRKWDSVKWGPWPHQPGCLVPRELLRPEDGQGWEEHRKAS